ncbi:MULTISPECIES: hypothetical protein [Bacillus subtilis group]|nr:MULTISPECIES: hypothetical protein [Bacillus subtilis group]MDR4959651.1 hypothetical protein [Bacillus sonorensis]TWM68757.1 hypothetical protein CHCC14813_2142 [Bacillus licheniformis]
MKADITFGDLVAVDGYPDRIFYVDARRKVEEEDDAMAKLKREVER